MPEGPVTTGWTALTGKLQGLWSRTADGASVETSRAYASCIATTLENSGKQDASQQAARLATWEDEGGTTSG